MSTRKSLLALILSGLAVLTLACGAAPGSNGTTGANADSEAAAKALGVDLTSCGTDPAAKFDGHEKVGQSLALSGGGPRLPTPASPPG